MTTKDTSKITGEQCVLALKIFGRVAPASLIAEFLATDSRAVATAMRKPTKDGRVSFTFRRGVMHYRFVRTKPKAAGQEGRIA